ncbi:MAG: hypothetical protein WDN02_08130 [Methylovirgula sp.]|uniref:hypothetical protein n=1 Tax=Methylovirgula sp. TaxID=1978224 RepID=UPI00307616A1
MPKYSWMALVGVGLLSGCGSMTGPPSITASRTFYNEVIHDTSSEQLLLNIVRAKNYETPNFIDVSEADATVSFTSGVNGGLSGIGAVPGIHSTSAGTIAGQVGGVTGNFNYADSALVRYAPVQGYPLIQQVSSPIAPVSIVHMFNSDFGLADVLEFSVDRLAPGYTDNYVAQDRMVMLDQFGAIVLAAGAEEEGSGGGKRHRGSAAAGPSRDSAEDSSTQNLNVILHPGSLHPSGFIAGRDCTFAEQSPDAAVTKLWSGLRQLYRGSAANMITLRGAATSDFFFTTRSAIGALKEGEVDTIHFATPEEAAEIRALNNAAPCRINANIFYFNPPADKRTPDEVNIMWSSYLADALVPRVDQDIRARTIWRDTHRAFIIVEQGPGVPQNAYVAVNKRGTWYWIDNDDLVSKANFGLLNEIVTIQAVPETRQPLTPSISVGR